MTVLNMDCIEGMRLFPDNSFDSIVTDPPYGIRFMGKAWDGADIEKRIGERRACASSVEGSELGGYRSIAAEAGKYDRTPKGMLAFQTFSEEWAREAFRVLKPGGHLLSFSSARTYHRMACGIEAAGFEIRDQIMWVFGSGFPKSFDVSKAIDQAAGVKREIVGSAFRAATGRAEQGSGGYAFNETYDLTAPATDAAQQWEGWGTALKPAHEPICVARKPLIGTVAANVLQFGTGAIHVDACRVGDEIITTIGSPDFGTAAYGNYSGMAPTDHVGRWPANLIHDGSDEVVATFPQAAGQLADASTNSEARKTQNVYGNMRRGRTESENRGAVGFKMKPGARRADAGSAARFFYCAKASKSDRNAGLEEFEPKTVGDGRTVAADNAYQRGKTPRANTHPTVKPTALMRYLVRLVTPPGGTVLDPFAGSGSTGKACALEGFHFLGFELEAEYVAIANARMAAARG